MFLIYPLILAVILLLVLYLFVIQPFAINGNSMLPTYSDKTYVMADKLSYNLYRPQRGDIVIYTPLQRNGISYIARVIAIPDDKLVIENHLVNLNDNDLQEDYLSNQTRTFGGALIKEGNVYIVPQNQYFILGDNREHSNDSREFGFIPRENIKAKVRFCYSNCR